MFNSLHIFLTAKLIMIVCCFVTTASFAQVCDPVASGNPDTDGDGISNVCDLDDDNDGILDSLEGVEFANWAALNNTSGTASFGCNSNINYSYSITNGTLQVLNAEQFDDVQQIFEAEFGQAGSEENLRISSIGGGVGDTIVENVLTINFVGTVPANTLAFAIIDVEGEQGIIEALDSLGAPVPLATINSWFREVFDANIVTNGNANIPSWSNAVGGFVAENDNDGIFNTHHDGGATFSESAGLWLLVNTPITQLTLKISNTFDNASTFSSHLYMAAHCDTDLDGIPNHLDLDSDGDGCSDADEAYNTYQIDTNGDGTYAGAIGITEVNSNGLVIAALNDNGASPLATSASTETIYLVTPNTNYLDNLMAVCPPLPISLVEYTAKKVEESVILSWKTASEINNDYFKIEKSTDTKDWSFLTEIKGAGNSSSELNYQKIDNKPSIGVNYYRLSQYDFNGTSEVLGIRAVQFNDIHLDIKIHPNPVTDILTISIGSDTSIKEKSILYNNLGKEVKAIQIKGKQTKVDISTLSQGIYHLKINNHVFKVIKR